MMIMCFDCVCVCVCSAKQLVRGEPNVSYICSRYYRAPELIFGATDYTSSIGSCHTQHFNPLSHFGRFYLIAALLFARV